MHLLASAAAVAIMLTNSVVLATTFVGNGYLAGSKDARFMDCNYTAEQ
jgi:hypothetical protein